MKKIMVLMACLFLVSACMTRYPNANVSTEEQARILAEKQAASEAKAAALAKEREDWAVVRVDPEGVGYAIISSVRSDFSVFQKIKSVMNHRFKRELLVDPAAMQVINFRYHNGNLNTDIALSDITFARKERYTVKYSVGKKKWLSKLATVKVQIVNDRTGEVIPFRMGR